MVAASAGRRRPESLPAEYRAQVGNVTVAKTVPQIKAFLEQGGTVVTIGSSTSLASHLKLMTASSIIEDLVRSLRLHDRRRHAHRHLR